MLHPLQLLHLKKLLELQRRQNFPALPSEKKEKIVRIRDCDLFATVGRLVLLLRS